MASSDSDDGVLKFYQQRSLRPDRHNSPPRRWSSQRDERRFSPHHRRHHYYDEGGTSPHRRIKEASISPPPPYFRVFEGERSPSPPRRTRRDDEIYFRPLPRAHQEEEFPLPRRRAVVEEENYFPQHRQREENFYPSPRRRQQYYGEENFYPSPWRRQQYYGEENFYPPPRRRQQYYGEEDFFYQHRHVAYEEERIYPPHPRRIEEPILIPSGKHSIPSQSLQINISTTRDEKDLNEEKEKNSRKEEKNSREEEKNSREEEKNSREEEKNSREEEKNSREEEKNSGREKEKSLSEEVVEKVDFDELLVNQKVLSTHLQQEDEQKSLFIKKCEVAKAYPNSQVVFMCMIQESPSTIGCKLPTYFIPSLPNAFCDVFLKESEAKNRALQAWKPYLLSKEFIVHIGHKFLKQAKDRRQSSSSHATWINYLVIFPRARKFKSRNSNEGSNARSKKPMIFDPGGEGAQEPYISPPSFNHPWEDINRVFKVGNLVLVLMREDLRANPFEEGEYDVIRLGSKFNYIEEYLKPRKAIIFHEFEPQHSSYNLITWKEEGLEGLTQVQFKPP